MANFLGYLFKATKTNDIFPSRYIAYDSYKCTPNQREELKAYRDDNTRELYRVTASGMKTKIVFSTRENLHKVDKDAIMTFFYNAEALESDSTTAHKQRKVQLTFWDEENNQYKTGYFYRPNMDFTIRSIVNNGDGTYDIVYNKFELELIEY